MFSASFYRATLCSVINSKQSRRQPPLVVFASLILSCRNCASVLIDCSRLKCEYHLAAFWRWCEDGTVQRRPRWQQPLERGKSTKGEVCPRQRVDFETHFVSSFLYIPSRRRWMSCWHRFERRTRVKGHLSRALHSALINIQAGIYGFITHLIN